MINPQFTPELIADFWQTVHQALVDDYEFSIGEAWESINRYRAELEHFGVREMVYHHEPTALAQSLAGRTSDLESTTRP